MRIAVLDDYQQVALACADWSRLPNGAEVQSFSDRAPTREALIERLRPFDVIVAMRERTRFPADLLAELARLRLIVTTGPHNAAIDIAEATRRGITVCGTDPGGLRHATAELTWALMLALARRVVREDRAVRQGKWQVSLGTSLRGSVLGILGLGHLGQQVCDYGKAFGMQVIAWSPNLTDERAVAAGALRVERDELFRQADFVSVHLKLAPGTRGLVGARELARMKPTAFLVNTSRGPIVDEGALIEALRSGRIAGAGLDTFDEEPLPAGHPLLGLDNTILTPHIGYVIEETYREWYQEAIEDICAFEAGAPIRVIDKPADYEAGIR